MEHYVVTYEQLTPKHSLPQSVDLAKSPFILENLGKYSVRDFTHRGMERRARYRQLVRVELPHSTVGSVIGL